MARWGLFGTTKGTKHTKTMVEPRSCEFNHGVCLEHGVHGVHVVEHGVQDGRLDGVCMEPQRKHFCERPLWPFVSYVVKKVPGWAGFKTNSCLEWHDGVCLEPLRASTVHQRESTKKKHFKKYSNDELTIRN